MGLTWSDAPLAAVYSRPYVVALMPNHIEIRSAQHISQKGLAQVQQAPCDIMSLPMTQLHQVDPCNAFPYWCRQAVALRACPCSWYTR